MPQKTNRIEEISEKVTVLLHSQTPVGKSCCLPRRRRPVRSQKALGFCEDFSRKKLFNVDSSTSNRQAALCFQCVFEFSTPNGSRTCYLLKPWPKKAHHIGNCNWLWYSAPGLVVALTQCSYMLHHAIFRWWEPMPKEFVKILYFIQMAIIEAEGM